MLKRAKILLVLILGFISFGSFMMLMATTVDDEPLYVSPSTPKSITVTNPTSSSSWEMESIHTITWTTTGDIDTVNIDLYKDNSHLDYIAVLVSNDGSYDWFIPNDLQNGTDYQVVISDFYEPSLRGFSAYFEIHGVTEFKSITVTNPTSSSSWEMESVHTITWTTTGDINLVSIDLYKDNSLTHAIAVLVPNDGSYDWFIPNDLQSDSDYRILIYYHYNYFIQDFSEYFEIREPAGPKSITVINPTSSSSWEIGSVHSIRWSSTGGITDVGIELYEDDAFLEMITFSTPNDGSYSWSIPSNLNEGNRFQLMVYDSDDYSIRDFSAYFSIVNGSSNDGEPEIIVIAPTSDVTWYKGNTYLIQWTCSQNPAQFDIVNIRLYKGNHYVRTIAEQVQNDDQYTYLIPEDIDVGDDYRIYIQLLDATTEIHQYSEYFRISKESGDSNSIDFISIYPLLIMIGMGSIILLYFLRRHIKR